MYVRERLSQDSEHFSNAVRNVIANHWRIVVPLRCGAGWSLEAQFPRTAPAGRILIDHGMGRHSPNQLPLKASSPLSPSWTHCPQSCEIELNRVHVNETQKVTATSPHRASLWAWGCELGVDGFKDPHEWRGQTRYMKILIYLFLSLYLWKSNFPWYLNIDKENRCSGHQLKYYWL